jgi:Rrf2 family nitric oxide-sensitive transcriptional repressor
MTLTRFSDYSLQVLMYAALRNPEKFSIDEVSDACHLSRHHVAKVVQWLAHEHYLLAKRGRTGGLTLGCQPSEIRIGRLVRNSEKGAPLVECFDPATNTCRLRPACKLRGILGESLNAFYTNLDRYTLTDLLVQPRKLARTMALAA